VAAIRKATAANGITAHIGTTGVPVIGEEGKAYITRFED
jgi:hypothetical protein